jgi:hypothetical protein
MLRVDIIAVDDTGNFTIDGIPPEEAEVGGTIVTGACDAFLLAAVEVLLHETTQDVAPDRIRVRVLRPLVRTSLPTSSPLGRQAAASSPPFARSAILSARTPFGSSDILDDVDLQSFLRSSQDVQDLISGVYRMNRAGRLGGAEGGGGAAASAAAAGGERWKGTFASSLPRGKTRAACSFAYARATLFGIHEPSAAASVNSIVGVAE